LPCISIKTLNLLNLIFQLAPFHAPFPPDPRPAEIPNRVIFMISVASVAGGASVAGQTGARARMKLKSAFDARHGEAVRVAPNVVRVTAANAGPFTFAGTNTYMAGDSNLAVIDPGPDLPAHFEALRAAIGTRKVTGIFITHAHRDHTDLLPRLAALTGAPVYAEGRHRAFRRLRGMETNVLDASADHDFTPGRALADGETVSGSGWALQAVHTPGHTASHCAYALNEQGILFSGDHVMGWSTSIIAPPDGSMAAYMASLHKLLARGDRLYLPGHGGPVTNPKSFTKGLIAHRRMRERAILQRLRAGDSLIPQIVAALYRDVDPRLHGAAALSVFAHLEHLIDEGRVRPDGEALLMSRYFAV
jgi:glyoxylase-like metal-dependent hydrolase (beta-lactamase superfamily II)